MIKDALYAVTHGQDLSYDLAKDTMNKIMSGDVAEVPMAGFLCALAAKGPTVDEVTGFCRGYAARRLVLYLMKVLLWKS